jgi:hypothetical protein
MKEEVPNGLSDAVYSLEEMAQGRPPEKARLLAGALAVNTIILRGRADRDVLDAGAGLEALAKGEEFELDEIGRKRALHLASVLSKLA